MKRDNRYGRYPCVLAVSIAAASAVQAQNSTGSSADRAVSRLEEIVVTAERREASLQETDLSLSVFGSTAVEELGVSNYADVGDYTPNLKTHPVGGGNAGFAANIRGIRSGETVTAFDPKVAVYLDGVLIAKNTGSALDVADIERVEVLRGPQGTLYGRNTIGGAINVITKKPIDDWRGKVTVTMGNYARRDVKGVLNVPLLGDRGVLGAGEEGSTLNLKASFASLNRDGYWDSDIPGGPSQELDDSNRDVGRVQLQWRPTEFTSFLYSYDNTRIREHALPYHMTLINTDLASPIPGLVQPYFFPDEPPSTFRLNGNKLRELDVEGHSLTADIDFENLGILGAATLTSITAYRESETAGANDADQSPSTILHAEAASDLEQFTQELRLVGTTASESLDYVVGLYYMEESGFQSNDTILDTGITFGLGVYTDIPFISAADVTFENDIWAIFAEGTYHLTDKLDLTFGLRYTEEERTMNRNNISAGAAIGPEPIVTALPQAGPRKFDNISPMVGLSYQWTNDVMVYAKVVQGYQSGGFNARARTPVAFQKGYAEEELTSYEMGLKSTWMEGKLQVNSAVFYSDYSDLQVNVLDPDTLGNNLQNAADAKISGLELEMVARPIYDFEAGLSYGYIDPEYSDFIEPGTGKDLTHWNFPYTPEHSVNVYGRYVIRDVLPGDLVARVDWVWQDEYAFASASPEPNSQDAYALLNARLTLQNIEWQGAGTLKLSVWGKNLNDETFYTSGVNLLDNFGFAVNSTGTPRTYGVDVSYEF